MKDRPRVNEWECIHLKPQDLLRDAYWINRAWMLDLEWSTQAVLVMTSLISAPLWMGCGLHIHILKSQPWRATRAVGVFVRMCSGLCLCVLSLCLGLCAGNESIIGIAFHSSITFLSGRIPLSPKTYLLYVDFVDQASVWLECRLYLTRGWVLARGVRCVSQLWHCLTPAAFECSFKACLTECFSPHVLALFTNPPPPPLQLSAVFFQFTFALMSFPPPCVLYSAVHRVLWQRLFAGLRQITTQLWPLQGPQCQRSMESMVKDRNMEAEEAAWHILYQLGAAVLVCVHVQYFLSFIKIWEDGCKIGCGLLSLGLFSYGVIFQYMDIHMIFLDFEFFIQALWWGWANRSKWINDVPSWKNAYSEFFFCKLLCNYF